MSEVQPLPADMTVPATMWDPALTYYADGTAVIMTWDGGTRAGVTCGMTRGGIPYEFQAVRWADDSVSRVAPHVLRRAEEYGQVPSGPSPSAGSANADQAPAGEDPIPCTS